MERRDPSDWGRLEDRRDTVPRWASGPRAPWYSERNYWLFRVLAGTYLELGVPRTRGLPRDISAETNAQAGGSECHHGQHLTIGELLQIPWNGRVEVDYDIDDRCASGELGRASRVLSFLAENDSWPDLPAMSMPPNSISGPIAEFTIPVTLQRPLVERASEDFLACLVRMASAASGDLQSVRAVFWYDQAVPGIDERQSPGRGFY